jgi:ribosomal protein L12E/L44/L45/RPP1/RPP2/soluble cytochrome b562
VSATETGMISESDLLENDVLMVATKNDSVTYGNVTFDTPQGRVFLKVPGGLLKLKNRQLTEKEVNAIYDVMLQVTKNTQRDGTTKTKETQYLFSWLKTVVYWGIPRNTQTGERKENPGFNSVWFEDVIQGNKTFTKLFMSGLGAEPFDFTVSGLQNKENEIKAVLRGMYNNVNATLVNENSFRDDYTEILGIDENGEPIKKEWDNYQTYLLSSEGRTADEIPLVTQVRPLTDPDVPNKKGIYFTLDSTSDDFEIPVPPPVATAAPAPKAATKPTAKKDALERIKNTVNTEEDIEPFMDGIFNIIDQDKYIAWQETLDQEELAIDLGNLLEDVEQDEASVYNITSKYLLNKYIDELLDQANKTVAPVAALVNAEKQYDIEGGNNDYALGKYGNLSFKINGQEFVDTNEEKGFTVTFVGPTMDAFMTDRGITDPQEAKDIASAAILAKLRPQLDALKTKSKVPAANAPQTTFQLDGLAENTVQIGGYGKIVFTLDGNKFNETGDGFNIQFGSYDGEVTKGVMQAKGISQAEAQQLIGDDIYGKVYTQLEAMKVPNEPPLATPFTPNVPEVVEEAPEEAPVVVEETPTTPSSFQEGVDWSITTADNIKPQLVSGEVKEITSSAEEPGETIKFSYLSRRR